MTATKQTQSRKIPDENRLPEERKLIWFVRMISNSSESSEDLKVLARAVLIKARAA